MATTTDDGFHEIHLNGKQLVFLFMAVTVVSVVIFLCGVLVGRGVRASSPGDAIAELTGTALPPAPDPAAPGTSSGAPATANEPLSYPGRLAGAEPAPEKLREGNAPAATTKPAPMPSTPAPAPSNPTPEASTPTPPPATPPPAPRPTTPAPAATAVAGEPAGAGFAIQVAALRERNEAETIVRRLSGKGYAAYVLPPSSGTPTMYRVRVGKFKERREADAVAARLQKEEQFKPWIVR
jgi:DedD protein